MRTSVFNFSRISSRQTAPLPSPAPASPLLDAAQAARLIQFRGDQLVDAGWICASPGSSHHLTNQKTGRLFFARLEVGDRLRILPNGLPDCLPDFILIGYLFASFGHDVRGAAAGLEHGPEYVSRHLSAYAAGVFEF